MTNKKFHNDSDELLLCFDKRGAIIKPQPRNIVHNKPYRIWHAVVNIWVLNYKGELLCTRRAQHVSGNPGMWQTYVGGHVKASSNFYETAQRELIEEIGLKINNNDLKFIEKGRREDSLHLYESYGLIFNKKLSALNFTDGEISEARWLNFKDYQKIKSKKPTMWCNGIEPQKFREICKIFDL